MPRIQSEEWRGFESAFVEIDSIHLYMKNKLSGGQTLAATLEWI
jgi:hypothetical protein